MTHLVASGLAQMGPWTLVLNKVQNNATGINKMVFVKLFKLAPCWVRINTIRCVLLTVRMKVIILSICPGLKSLDLKMNNSNHLKDVQFPQLFCRFLIETMRHWGVSELKDLSSMQSTLAYLTRA
jgi:hypothetical protein